MKHFTQIKNNSNDMSVKMKMKTSQDAISQITCHLEAGNFLPVIPLLIELSKTNQPQIDKLLFPILASIYPESVPTFRNANLSQLVNIPSSGLNSSNIIKYAPRYVFYSHLKSDASESVSEAQNCVKRAHSQIFRESSNIPMKPQPNALLLASNGFLQVKSAKSIDSFNYTNLVLFVQFLDYFTKKMISPTHFVPGSLITPCTHHENLESLSASYKSGHLSQHEFLTELYELFNVNNDNSFWTRNYTQITQIFSSLSVLSEIFSVSSDSSLGENENENENENSPIELVVSVEDASESENTMQTPSINMESSTVHQEQNLNSQNHGGKKCKCPMCDSDFVNLISFSQRSFQYFTNETRLNRNTVRTSSKGSVPDSSFRGVSSINDPKQNQDQKNTPLELVFRIKDTLITLIKTLSIHQVYNLPLDSNHWDPVIWNTMSVSHLFVQFVSSFNPLSISLLFSDRNKVSTDRGDHILLAQNISLILFEYCFTFSLAPFLTPGASSALSRVLEHHNSLSLQAYFSSSMEESCKARLSFYTLESGELPKSGDISKRPKNLELEPNSESNIPPTQNTILNQNIIDKIPSAISNLACSPKSKTKSKTKPGPSTDLLSIFEIMIHQLEKEFPPASETNFLSVHPKIEKLFSLILKMSLFHIVPLGNLCKFLEEKTGFFMDCDASTFSMEVQTWISILAGDQESCDLSNNFQILFPMFRILFSRLNISETVGIDNILLFFSTPTPTKFFAEFSIFDSFNSILQKGTMMGIPSSVSALIHFNSHIISEIPRNSIHSLSESSEIVDYLYSNLIFSLFDHSRFSDFLSCLEVVITSINVNQTTDLLHLYNAVICRNSLSLTHFALISKANESKTTSFLLFSTIFSQLDTTWIDFKTRYHLTFPPRRIRSLLSLLYALSSKNVISFNTVYDNEISGGLPLSAFKESCNPITIFYNILNGSSQFKHKSSSGILNRHSFSGFTPKFSFSFENLDNFWSLPQVTKLATLLSPVFPIFLTIHYSHINDNYSLLIGEWHLQIIDALQSIVTLQSKGKGWNHLSNILPLSINQVLDITHAKSLSPNLVSNTSCSLLQSWIIHHDLAFLHLSIPFIHQKKQSSPKLVPLYIGECIMDLLTIDKFAYLANQIYQIAGRRKHPSGDNLSGQDTGQAQGQNMTQYSNPIPPGGEAIPPGGVNSTSNNSDPMSIYSIDAKKKTQFSIQDAFLVGHNFLFNLQFSDSLSSISTTGGFDSFLSTLNLNHLVTYSWVSALGIWKSTLNPSSKYFPPGEPPFGTRIDDTSTSEAPMVPFIPNDIASFITSERTLLCTFAHNSVFYKAIYDHFASLQSSDTSVKPLEKAQPKVLQFTASSSSSSTLKSKKKKKSNYKFSGGIGIPQQPISPSSSSTPPNYIIGSQGQKLPKPKKTENAYYIGNTALPKPYIKNDPYFAYSTPRCPWRGLPSITRIFLRPSFNSMHKENAWIHKFASGSETKALELLVQFFRLGQLDAPQRLLLGSYIFRKFFLMTQDASTILLLNARFCVRMGYISEMVTNLLAVSQLLLPFFENKDISYDIGSENEWLQYLGVDTDIINIDEEFDAPTTLDSPISNTPARNQLEKRFDTDTNLKRLPALQFKKMAQYVILQYAYYCRLLVSSRSYPEFQYSGKESRITNLFYTTLGKSYTTVNPICPKYPNLVSDLDSYHKHQLDKVLKVCTDFQIFPSFYTGTYLSPAVFKATQPRFYVLNNSIFKTFHLKIKQTRHPDYVQSSSVGDFQHIKPKLMTCVRTPTYRYSGSIFSFRNIFKTSLAFILAVGPTYLFWKYAASKVFSS